MIAALIRRSTVAALFLGVSACSASGSVTPGYFLEVTLRTAQESPGRPYVLTLPMDAAAARELQSNPAESIRPHLVAARQTYARSRGYQGPAFRFSGHDIAPISGWRWRLLQAGSDVVLVQGSSRWRPSR